MTSISPLPLDMEWVAETAGNAMFNDRCRGILRPDWSDQFGGALGGWGISLGRPPAKTGHGVTVAIRQQLRHINLFAIAIERRRASLYRLS
ncbi:hypothetical protein WJ32_02510 [Burkholderia ubonensis]|uniref:Uncharacterized protein n=2 Tax=Burkholderia ubonensis TaxID=101571 RepID=A0A118HQZ1_9BURK|nr:hypothetical protein WJ32_02510 [Burkholderia ubonensis]KVG63481.1 hypothetical protein WJ33_03655 [Burkholderia ubonensis]